ncbi:MAG: diaminopropionate ammonia-lyase [Bacteroidetes bacterium HGW-Bacteroidetes-17]|nr:MAG: diaminopropionate ammonia-lyase [Bacteroidetes bacterium HGW-Bacteroidetes-17]
MIAADYTILKPSYKLATNRTSEKLRTSDPINFHSTLNNYMPTPLLHLPKLAKWLGVQSIFVKDESFRFGLKSFKGLGTSYALHKIITENPNIHTYCTATDGNHGRALAWSARLAEKIAVIIVPKHTTSARIEAIKSEGAKVEIFDGNYDDACLYADKLSSQDGWQLVQDVAWEGYEEIPAQIMCGYLSIFKELENSLHPNAKAGIDLVFLQAGVGSFASAAAWYYLNRYGIKKPKIVIVEPLEADGILESFKQKKLSCPKGKQQTIMAGLNCGLPSTIAWPILQSGINACIRIEDDYTKQAMRILADSMPDDPTIIAGESGAAGIAAFLAILREKKFKSLLNHLDINESTRILFFNTEGDTDPESFHQIITSLE